MLVTIYDIIAREVLQVKGINCWLASRDSVYNKLDKLQPSIPEDGSIGQIAFNVPGKDRMKIKTGRFLTRKLNLNTGFLSDKSIAMIASKLNMVLFPDIRIELVNGDSITANYRDEVGSESCMTTNGCGGGPNCTRLYEDNPDRFQMLTMYFLNDSARAIVHKLDNGKYYMDRVYASCEMLKDRMREYAESAGWECRKTDIACDYDFSCPDSELVVSGLDYTNGEVPYMDTMINGCTCGRGLTISADGCCDVELTSTDGSLDRISCCNCNESVDEDNSYTNDYGEVYCDSCYNEIYGHCENCDDTVLQDDIVKIEDAEIWVCKYCANDQYIECEDCGKYYKENYYVIEDVGYCQSCAEKYPICKECNEQSTDEDFLNENGLCSDCIELESLPVFVPAESVGQQELNYEDNES